MMKRDVFIILLLPSLALAGPTNFTAATAAEYLKMTPPVTVEMAGGFTDGGSIGVTLVDANTNKFHMFEDYSLGTTTGGRIYVADDKPRRGGRLTSVDEGVLIRAAVVCLAQDWVRRTTRLEEPKHTRDNLNTYFRVRMQNYAREYITQKWKPPEPTTAPTATNQPALRTD